MQIDAVAEPTRQQRCRRPQQLAPHHLDVAAGECPSVPDSGRHRHHAESVGRCGDIRREAVGARPRIGVCAHAALKAPIVVPLGQHPHRRNTPTIALDRAAGHDDQESASGERNACECAGPRPARRHVPDTAWSTPRSGNWGPASVCDIRRPAANGSGRAGARPAAMSNLASRCRVSQRSPCWDRAPIGGTAARARSLLVSRSHGTHRRGCRAPLRWLAIASVRSLSPPRARLRAGGSGYDESRYSASLADTSRLTFAAPDKRLSRVLWELRWRSPA